MAPILAPLAAIGGALGATGTAATLLGAATAGLAVKGLSSAVSGGGSSAPAATPATTTGPTVMPLADSQAVLDAKRKATMAQIAREGRSSTMLTTGSSDSSKLGG